MVGCVIPCCDCVVPVVVERVAVVVNVRLWNSVVGVVLVAVIMLVWWRGTCVWLVFVGLGVGVVLVASGLPWWSVWSVVVMVSRLLSRQVGVVCVVLLVLVARVGGCRWWLACW